MQTPKKFLFSYSAGIVLDTSECKPNMMNTIFRADEKYFKIPKVNTYPVQVKIF